MKILKTILLFIAAVIVLALIVAAFIDGHVQYEKSVQINAPVEKVWGNVNSLAAMDKWSPWNSKDPDMKRTNEGTDGTPGAKFCWESEKEDVGKGCQTIKSLQAPNRIDTELKFFTPYESDAQAYVVLAPSGAGTKATWGLASEMPYPFRIMKLFTSMEKMLDPDFTLGTNKLKEISERP